MAPQTLELPELAAELSAASPELGEQEQRLALALYRLLAEGDPVDPGRLAERVGLEEAAVPAIVDRWPGVYRNEAGLVVGFWGLALAEMPHRMRVDGRELRGWCSWDTLFLPELIGKTAKVESTCPTTRETVSLEVGPEGPRNVSPAGAVISFMRPDGPFDADVVRSFCHHVRFFASAEAADEWTAQHASTFVMSIADGFELGRLVNRANFGAALAAEPA